MRITTDLFRLGYEIGPIRTPISSRDWEPDQLEGDPSRLGTRQPEDEEHCSRVLGNMLLRNEIQLPEGMRLKGAAALEISPYTFFASDRFPTRTIMGSVDFYPHDPDFEAIYGTDSLLEKLTAAKRALRDTLEKFQSMCETPGALSWATSRIIQQERFRAVCDHGLARDYETQLALLQKLEQQYPAGDPPKFAGNRVLPESVYRADLRAT